MKSRICIFIFSIFVSSSLFSQNAANNPFLGIWFAETEDGRFVQIFTDGIIVQLSEGSDTAQIFEYTISGNSLITDGQDITFTIMDNNRIILELNDASILLIRQTNIAIKEKIEDFLNEIF